MRIGSLFSGIGGLELGLEMSGLGETVWQVEKDEFCRAVLAKHWPNVERFEDVTQVGSHNLADVDVICGGFPCQDVSSAGKRAGLAGARSGLWFEYLRVITELRPPFVVVENVASGARAWVDTVCTGLGEQGYAWVQIPIEAAHVGALHKRARIFIVAAYADTESKLAGTKHAEMGSAQTPAANTQQQQLRVESGRRSGSRWACQTVAKHVGWGSAQPDMVRVVHGLSRGLDKPVRRIAALGNAVVPQCAEVIGHFIQELCR